MASCLAAAVPGVGRYTAAAVASIAAGQAVAVLDGNVARVVARMRGVGTDTNEKRTQEHFWRLSGDVLEPARPGDSNQALMELGATVCTPKKVRCDVCPVQDLCYAYKKSSLTNPFTDNDKENPIAGGGARNSPLLNHFSVDSKKKMSVKNIKCPVATFASNKDPGISSVTNFPRKAAKASSRRQVTVVLVLARGREAGDHVTDDNKEEDELMVLQRPKTGLLANLWELISVPLTVSTNNSVKAEETKSKTQNELGQNDFSSSDPGFPYDELRGLYGIGEECLTNIRYVDDVVHIFSHIHQTYRVFSGRLSPDALLPPVPASHQAIDFLTRVEFAKAAVSTAMKKVLKAVDTTKKKVKVEKGGPKTALKQTTLGQFFIKKK